MKQNKNTEKLPLREAARLNKKAFDIWRKKAPMLFVSSAAHSALGSLSPYVGIYLSALIINELAGARDPGVLTRLVLITLISAAALSLVGAAVSRWKSSLHSCRNTIEEEIYSEKFLSMDFCSVDDQKTHDLFSQIKQNRNWSGWGLGKLVSQFEWLISVVTKIAGGAALSVSLFTLRVPESGGRLTVLNNPLFIALIAAVMLAVMLLSPLLSNKARQYWSGYASHARHGNRVFSFFGFMAFERDRAMDVRIYRQDILCKKLNLKRDGSFGPKSKIAALARGPMGLLSALSSVVSNVFTGIIYVFVCLKALGGAFGVGSVTQYIGAISALSTGAASLVSLFGDLRTNASFLKTTFEFLDIGNPMYQGSLTVEKRSDRCYEIEFKNVGFKYPGADFWALKNVSIKFRVGERLAVVGQNGSGKTTFIKLLCRLYDPTEGEIQLNGIDIRKYNYDEYMSIFSVVFQDFKLLSYSLGQNVAASAVFNRERVVSCLEKSGFGERLNELERGVDTNIYREFNENGVEISGGEAQKIALARALYKDAPFIVLDEPTAALDPVAEYEVYSKFNEIVGNKTAIFISHRLSSCRFCGDIAVFHEGEIIQRGSHEELVSDENGKYRELWHAQAQYYAKV